jgi:hypothetical protein
MAALSRFILSRFATWDSRRDNEYRNETIGIKDSTVPTLDVSAPVESGKLLAEAGLAWTSNMDTAD